MAKVLPYRGKHPDVSKALFLAETAAIIGDVTLGRDVSVWYSAVLRGDANRIEVGDETNIQDGAVLHGTHGLWPVVVGSRVTVGHGAIVHGCVVEDDVLIGMGAVIMDGARVGRFSIVAAGALVPPGMQIPERSLVVGVPAKIKREVTPEEIENLIRESYRAYLEYGREARKG